MSIEAKDTVMDEPTKQGLLNTFEIGRLETWMSLMPKGELEQWLMEWEDYLCKAQAEISFKAGMKKVVEWVKSHSEWDYEEIIPKKQWLYEPTNDRYKVRGVLIPTSKEDWQSKLKEWGIEQ